MVFSLSFPIYSCIHYVYATKVQFFVLPFLSKVATAVRRWWQNLVIMAARRQGNVQGMLLPCFKPCTFVRNQSAQKKLQENVVGMYVVSARQLAYKPIKYTSPLPLHSHELPYRFLLLDGHSFFSGWLLKNLDSSPVLSSATTTIE